MMVQRIIHESLLNDFEILFLHCIIIKIEDKGQLLRPDLNILEGIEEKRGMW